MMLGNFSINDMERRLGISFPAELKEFMKDSRQEDISKRLAAGKWHCFDIPFFLFVSDMDTAIKFRDFLVPFSEDMKTQIEIGIQGGAN